MKAELHFSGQPFMVMEQYDEKEKEILRRLNESINKKIEGKIISIPCLPTKDMAINLFAFSSIFGFTEEEMYYIESEPFYNVVDVIVYPKHIRISLDEGE
jgi:hypothetical protein